MSSSKVQKAISGSIIQNSARWRLVWLSADIILRNLEAGKPPRHLQQKMRYLLPIHVMLSCRQKAAQASRSMHAVDPRHEAFESGQMCSVKCSASAAELVCPSNHGDHAHPIRLQRGNTLNSCIQWAGQAEACQSEG